jgi:DNA-binding MarR family transcriptional regulator
MEEEIIQKLAAIGLTEGEAKTYLALLSLGTSTVGPIVDKSGVSASKVYQIIDRLMHKGLASMIVDQDTKKFTASDPSMIITYLEQEKARIESYESSINSIMPMLKLKKDSSEKQPVVEFTTGKKGFEAFLNEIIYSAKPGSLYCGMAGKDISFKLQELWYPMSVKMAEHKIHQKTYYEYTVWNKKDQNIAKRKQRKLYYPIVLDKQIHDLPNFLVLEGKAIITAIGDDGNTFSLIIRNKNLVNSIKNIFDAMEKLGTIPEGYATFKGDQK